jgi:translation initiation factor 3 subunit G
MSTTAVQKGTRTVEVCKLDEATGRNIKVIQKIALKPIAVSVPMQVAERLKWKKFGKATTLGDDLESSDPNPITTTVGDEVFLHLTRTKDFEGEKKPSDSSSNAGQAQSDKRVTCRSCGGDHWTAKCPFKDKLVAMEEAQAESASSGKYIAPSQRAKLASERDDSLTVRVTNLSQFTTEPDLQNLLRDLPPGSITRIFIVREYDTGLCKGYAFVSFLEKSVAERAISLLNGHGFGNLIIKAEFATPKPASSTGNPPHYHRRPHRY